MISRRVPAAGSQARHLRSIRMTAAAAAVAAFWLCSLTQIAGAEITHITCGGRGDRPCTVGDPEWWEGGLLLNGCDRGLDAKWIGYCAHRPCSICPCTKFRYPWQCRAGDRTDYAEEARGRGNRWYEEQLELGQHEPINWVNLIGTHNAFNNVSDSYIRPNQEHSMTEQLRAGARVLFLDVHQEATCNCLKLSHSTAGGTGDSIIDRHLIYGLREIREWLRDNPSQFVVLRFETYFEAEDAHDPELARETFKTVIAAELGPYLLTEAAKEANWPDRWPTLAELRAHGWRAIAIVDHWTADNEYVILGWYPAGEEPCPDEGDFPPCKISAGKTAYKVVEALSSGNALPMPTRNKFTHVEEDSLRARPVHDTCRTKLENWSDEDGMGMICPLDEPCEKGFPPFLLPWCPMDHIVSLDQVMRHGFSTVSFDQFQGYNVWSESGQSDFIDDEWVFEGLAWTWPESVPGASPSDRHWCASCRDNMAAVLNSNTGRWSWAPQHEVRRYACSPLRNASTDTEPTTTWEITEASGPWQDGAQACASEYGSRGLVFSVPTNSWQNEQLKEKMSSLTGSVWLAYRDVDPELNSTRFEIDHGLGESEISASPAQAHEGDEVEFISSWSSADLAGCWQSLETLGQLAEGDAWDFGDGTSETHSSEFRLVGGGAQFVARHRYRDNAVPYVVRHQLPEPCQQADRSRAQFVYNVAPGIRLDCESWDSCPEVVDRAETVVAVGETSEFRAAFLDPGADDTHEAEFAWGDGAQSQGTVERSADALEVATGSVSASHAYAACGTFRVDATLLDDDGGTGSEYQMVRVEEAPPVIHCPADIVAEATGPSGAAVELGQPVVHGGVCGEVETSSTARDHYPLGLTEVVWTARNSLESLDRESEEYVRLEDSCIQQVTVVDTTPPVIVSLAATPSVLWPPNKSMRAVNVATAATDIVDESPECWLSEIEVSPLPSGHNHAPTPYAITGSDSCNLLADREGSAGERRYTLSVTCTDDAGNSAVGLTDVVVPHDMRKEAKLRKSH